MKTIADVARESIAKWGTAKNTYDTFRVGDKVKVIAPCCDFYFFYGEKGTVTKNSHRYLGISVEFDKPRTFEDGYVQTGFNFNPTDLFRLTVRGEL